MGEGQGGAVAMHLLGDMLLRTKIQLFGPQQG